MSRSIRFATPIYRGVRFDDNALPVELLPDLSAYQDLVVEIASELFRLDHPDRKRLPNNFSDRFHLKLRTVEPGSAAPALERVLPDGALSLASSGDYFERARDVIEHTLRAAVAGGPLPREFPRQLLGRFNGIGQGLREDEYVLWCSGDQRDGPRYDRAVRKRLILTNASTYEQQVDLTGRVVAFDEERKSFELKSGVVRIPARFDASQLATVRSVIANADPIARLTGVGEFDADDRLRKVISFHALALVSDDKDIDLDARLDELSALRDGWLDGEGTAPTRATIDRAASSIRALSAEGNAPTPYLYPTPEGEIRAEWPLADGEITAIFDAAGERAYLHASNSRGELVEESDVEAGDVGALREFLARNIASLEVLP
jgi:hypothetical protein